MPVPEVKVEPAVLSKFLNHVAKGEQKDAEELLLSHSPQERQILLCSADSFSDYSKRTFNCPGYLYAYWALDIHMCNMLQKYMNENTKTYLSKQIDRMESFCANFKRKGLKHEQEGETLSSTHFSFKTLKEFLNECKKVLSKLEALKVDGSPKDALKITKQKELEAYLQAIQRLLYEEQKNLPAHVVNEYCRKNRAFYPPPAFNETTLPRIISLEVVTYQQQRFANETHRACWYDNVPFEHQYGVIRDSHLEKARREERPSNVTAEQFKTDLLAITNLEHARYRDLKKCRDFLRPPKEENPPSLARLAAYL